MDARLANVTRPIGVLVEATRTCGAVNLQNIVPSDISETGGLSEDREIFVGAKVIVRSNIETYHKWCFGCNN